MPITPTTLEESAMLISGAQKKLGSSLDSFYEKIAFYSAGSLSLSITFLGYISSWSINPIKGFQCINYFCFPIYYILIFSWAMFFLSVVLGLYMRLFFSKSLLFNVWKEHIKLKIEEKESVYRKITIQNDKGKATINNTGLTSKEYLKQNENEKKALEELLVKHETREKLFNFVARKHEVIIISIFISGLFSALVFTFFVFLQR